MLYMCNPLGTLSWDFRGAGVVFLYHGSSGAFVSSGLWHIHTAAVCVLLVCCAACSWSWRSLDLVLAALGL